MKVIKFGGQSLSNGKPLQRCIEIIQHKLNQNEQITVVVSARGETTNQLLELMNYARQNKSIDELWNDFISYQIEPIPEIDFSVEIEELRQLLKGIELLHEYSDKIEAKVLGYGEIFSAIIVTKLIQNAGFNSQFVDSRRLIITDSNYLNALPLEELSEEQTKLIVQPILDQSVTPIVTGFIGSDLRRDTTTLGRNGSNYTASLLAKFLAAEKVENYTHVDGIFTADPNLIKQAKLIQSISYDDVNEMVNFGANILHAKTLVPLVEQSIPIEIKNTNAPLNNSGTLVSNQPGNSTAKNLSVLPNKALLIIEGRGLLGKVGIDQRIFSTMQRANVSVGIISQASSERGIGLVIDEQDSSKAVEALKQEFQYDFQNKDIQKISAQKGFSVVSLIGLELDQFAAPFQALIHNQVVPKLINNTVTGKNVSILISKQQTQKAIQIIHSILFEDAKPVYVAIFGTGNVGTELIEQILESTTEIQQRKQIKLVVFAIANSKKMYLNDEGIGSDWKSKLSESSIKTNKNTLFEYVEQHHLGNLIFIDNTASKDLANEYLEFVEHGFDIVSSNKIKNSGPIEKYKTLKIQLTNHKKQYLYETTVGAGLPLIDTIKLLHLSGENITRIRGVFSGSLSFMFNEFSRSNQPISELIKKAMELGYTEPNPMIDLSGVDVARKLLILARELDLENEIEDVEIEALLPEQFQNLSQQEFFHQLTELDKLYQKKKEKLQDGFVYRYVGDLHGDLSQSKALLNVRLEQVEQNSTLGQLSGADSIFELYTESYGDRPIIIQGSGAGAKVTARGVFGDILRISQRL